MRIIAGKFRGRRLQSPRGRETRPTADNVREAVFNLLGTRSRIENAHCLDLFCGTGAFGLEAISRGAAHATFVDTNRGALETAAANASALGVEAQCRFLRRDGVRYLTNRSSQRFDIIFADPPYDFPRLADIPGLAADLLRPNGVLVLEHDRAVRFTDLGGLVESRSYGRTIVTIFRASPPSPPLQAERK